MSGALTHIVITELDGIYNAHGRLLTSTCFWCNREATHCVTRSSPGKLYSNQACSVHAQQWERQMKAIEQGEQR